MPLMPKRVKYRKVHRRLPDGVAGAGHKLEFGEYGLQALAGSWVTAVQLEACRVAINRAMKRRGQVWIRVFPDMSKTKKPLEVRMGKGKGNVELWIAVVPAGRVLFELGGVDEGLARECLKLAAAKLPMATRFVARHHAA